MKSQNHRIYQVGKNPSGPSGRSSLLRQGHLRPHGTGLHADGSWISPVMEIPQPLWEICSSAWSPAQQKILPHVQVGLPVHQFLPIALCLLPIITKKSLAPCSWHYSFGNLYTLMRSHAVSSKGWMSPTSARLVHINIQLTYSLTHIHQ